jgi:hypothetical protein
MSNIYVAKRTSVGHHAGVPESKGNPANEEHSEDFVFFTVDMQVSLICHLNWLIDF